VSSKMLASKLLGHPWRSAIVQRGAQRVGQRNWSSVRRAGQLRGLLLLLLSVQQTQLVALHALWSFGGGGMCRSRAVILFMSAPGLAVPTNVRMGRQRSE
jgi:uncharacterized membrane protein